MACPRAGLAVAGGRTAPPRPESPCTCRASSAGRSSGPAQPAVTGVPAAPTNSDTASALAVVLASPTLPATVVMPTSSMPGCPCANAIASASSIPGSQSRMILVGMTVNLVPLVVPGKKGTERPWRVPPWPAYAWTGSLICEEVCHAHPAHPGRRDRRSGDRPAHRRRGPEAVREGPADPVGELRVGGRARGIGQRADQQVLRRLPRPALLRGPAVRRPGGDHRQGPGQGAVWRG